MFLFFNSRFADCVLIFHNDDIMNNLMGSTVRPGSKADSQKVSIEQMNESICFSIANLIHPVSFDGSVYSEMLSPEEGSSCERCKACTLKATTKSNGIFSPEQRGPTSAPPGFEEEQNFSKLSEKLKKSRISETTCPSSVVKEKRRTALQEESKSRSFDSSVLKNKRENFPTRKEQLAKSPGCDRNTRVPCTCSRRSAIADRDETDAIENTSNYDASSSSNILQHLTPLPNLKFVSSIEKRTKTITTDYKPVLMSLLRELPKSDPFGNKYKNAAATLVARGNCAKVFQYECDAVVNMVNKKLPFCSDVKAGLLTSKCKETQLIEYYSFQRVLNETLL